MRRLVEKTSKTTSRLSTLIHQHIALIDNFDARFVEILFNFSDFLLKDDFLFQVLQTYRKSFSRSGAGGCLRLACERTQVRSSPGAIFSKLVLLFLFSTQLFVGIDSDTLLLFKSFIKRLGSAGIIITVTAAATTTTTIIIIVIIVYFKKIIYLA